MTINQSRRRRGNLNLGGEQAEADPLINVAFYESDDFMAIESRSDPRCFIIGRTGGGKSAALQHLEEVHKEHVIRITPEDLSLPYITDLSAFRYLDSLDVHLDLLFIALWKHVMLVELIRHRYNVDSPIAKQNFFRIIRDRVLRDPAKQQALDYLDEFEGKFWCEADVRVREITDKFQQRVQAEMNAGLTLPFGAQINAGGEREKTFSSESRAEQAERFQRIVNETQLARLNKMIAVLHEDILDSAQHFTYVIIDDLDRDWVDNRLTNDLIWCLFRTVHDLKRVKNLKVIVALRTNIFEQLSLGDRSAGQEEKYRSLILPMRWTKNDIESMLDERVKARADDIGRSDIRRILDLLPPSRHKVRGSAFDYLLDHTLMRPRDAISYVNQCLRISGDKPRLAWDDLLGAETPYSQERLLALRDEWKVSYPDIEKVFALFNGVTMPMNRSVLTRVLDDAMLLPADREFKGTVWMTRLSEVMLTSGSSQYDWVELYYSLLKVLFMTGFLGLSRGQSKEFIFSHHDTGFVDRVSNVESADSFLVHAAFWGALNIKTSSNQG